MYDSTCKFIALEYSRDLATWLLGKPLDLRLFGLCYAMEGGYKGKTLTQKDIASIYAPDRIMPSNEEPQPII